MRRITVLLITAGMAATVVSASAAAPDRIVPCNEIIGNTKFPYIGNSRPQDRYRQLLGVLSVPPAYMEQVAPSGDETWPYWHKQGLVVRASGQAIAVSVPEAWRNRAAIAWGYGGKGEPFSSLRIAGCKGDPNTGNAYSGGFYLRSQSACVPLIFRVGNRSTTVRFGVGRICR